jgi:CBS-domain-containing membrane protein
MYRFLEGTADQYMTRAVTTVTRQTTMRELEALFEKHDFNSFPVVEERKMLALDLVSGNEESRPAGLPEREFGWSVHY